MTLDTDIYKAVMHISVMSGEKPGRILSRLARKALSTEPAKTGKSGRFPTFDVPAGAPVISAQHAQELIDEEGI